MTKKQISPLIVAVLSVALSACVTQEFANNETPVVKNQANRDDMAATRISLGLGYLRMGNMAQAKQNLEKARKFAPNMVQVYTAFAHYYETVGEHELTVSSFEKALSLKSDDADTLNNYGVYLCRQNQTEAAEAQFLKAIAVPTYVLVAKSYENLSSCFLQKDDFVKAEVYLYKAIMHSPGNSSTLLQMVRLQYAMGLFDQAKIYQQRFEKVTRRFTSQSLALAYKVHRKLGQRRTAKNYGTMLVKMYPQSWEAQQYLLNELELIEADNLAKRFKLTQISETPTKSKKRVVKLSPKKPVIANTQTNPVLVKPNILEQKTLPIVKVAKPKITKPVVTPLSTASSESINAALTMTKVETIPKTPVKKLPAASNLSMDTNKPDKSAEVLAASKEKHNKVVEIIPAVEIKKSVQIAQQNIETTKGTPEIATSLNSTTTKAKVADDVNSNTPSIHVVKSGDTLFGISIKYNVKIKALRRWNNLTSKKKIRIKDKLYIIDPKTVTE